MNKRIKKQFWLSPEDAKNLKDKAEIVGLSETAVIRLLIRGYEPRENRTSVSMKQCEAYQQSETTSISLP